MTTFRIGAVSSDSSRMVHSHGELESSLSSVWTPFQIRNQEIKPSARSCTRLPIRGRRDLNALLKTRPVSRWTCQLHQRATHAEYHWRFKVGCVKAKLIVGDHNSNCGSSNRSRSANILLLHAHNRHVLDNLSVLVTRRGRVSQHLTVQPQPPLEQSWSNSAFGPSVVDV